MKALEDKDWAEAQSHEEDPSEYKMKILSTHRSAIHRQIWEALEIGALPEEELLNKKKEWGINPLPRMTTMFLDHEDQQGDQGAAGHQGPPPPPGGGPPAATPPESPGRRPREEDFSDFTSQYKQRKKRRLAMEAQLAAPTEVERHREPDLHLPEEAAPPQRSQPGPEEDQEDPDPGPPAQPDHE